MNNLYLIKQEIVNIGKKLYKLGFSPATSGNISIKVDNEILITASGKCLGYLDLNDIVLIDFSGNSLESNKRASSEREMHIEIYKIRPEINVIIHAHPPKATSFATAGIALNKPILAESIITLGDVPVAKYETPSSLELAQLTAAECKQADAVLMSNHGVVVLGESTDEAFHRIETLESFAEITLWNKLLGANNDIPPNKIDELIKIKEQIKKAK